MMSHTWCLQPSPSRLFWFPVGYWSPWLCFQRHLVPHGLLLLDLPGAESTKLQLPFRIRRFSNVELKSPLADLPSAVCGLNPTFFHLSDPTMVSMLGCALAVIAGHVRHSHVASHNAHHHSWGDRSCRSCDFLVPLAWTLRGRPLWPSPSSSRAPPGCSSSSSSSQAGQCTKLVLILGVCQAWCSLSSAGRWTSSYGTTMALQDQELGRVEMGACLYIGFVAVVALASVCQLARARRRLVLADVPAPNWRQGGAGTHHPFGLTLNCIFISSSWGSPVLWWSVAQPETFQRTRTHHLPVSGQTFYHEASFSANTRIKPTFQSSFVTHTFSK